MTTPPDPEDLHRLFRQLGETMQPLQPVFDDAAAYLRAMHAALGGDEGVARLTAALEHHQAAAEAWEAEHPNLRYGQTCDCWCQRWGHGGVCTGYADTFHVGALAGEPLQVPMCTPCAELVDATTGAQR